MPTMTYAKSSIVIAALFAGATALFAGATTSHAETTGEPTLDAIYIVAPADGASFPDAPATVDISVATAGGDIEPISTYDLYIDEVLVSTGACVPFEGCDGFSVDLDVGVHAIRVVASNLTEDAVTVYVATEGGDTTTDGGDTTTDGGGSDDYADEDTGGGANNPQDRGCSVVDGSTAPWSLLGLPALLLLGAGRRRRQRA